MRVDVETAKMTLKRPPIILLVLLILTGITTLVLRLVEATSTGFIYKLSALAQSHKLYGLNPNWDWAKQGGGKFHYFIMAVFSTLSGFGCLVFRIFPNWSKQAKLWTHAVCLTLGTRAEIRNLAYFVDY